MFICQGEFDADWLRNAHVQKTIVQGPDQSARIFDRMGRPGNGRRILFKLDPEQIGMDLLTRIGENPLSIGSVHLVGCASGRLAALSEQSEHAVRRR